MLNHAIGLLVRPSTQWQRIASLPPATFNTMILFPCIMALLPAAAWYYGVTEVGWTVAGGDPIKLTRDSALTIIILFYFAMVCAVGIIGYFIHWMSDTYGAQSSFAKGIVIAGFTATPLFVAGLTGLHPILWLDMLLGVAAVCWATYLLYLGIPIVMDIPEERGFLFSSAVVAVCLVMVISIMAGSVLLWDFGAAPAFTD